MWDGYIEYDGTEIINVHRTERYARHRPWFRPVYNNDALGPMLGHREYRSPLQDSDAPWADPDDYSSYDFLGIYPLNISGFEDSSRTSTVVESLVDGGVPGRIRHATKTLTFSCALLADSEAGAEYGLRWLRRALLGSVCGGTQSSDGFGGTLCFLASEPEFDGFEIPWGATPAAAEGGWAVDVGSTVAQGGSAAASGAADPDITGDPFLTGGSASSPRTLLDRNLSLFTVTTIGGADPTECLQPFSRSFRNVAFNSGPQVTRKAKLSDGEVWVVSFTAVVGNPYEFGPELEVVHGFLDPKVAVPWAGGVEPAGASYDLSGFLYPDDGSCIPAEPAPLYDPLNPALILPPSVPSVPLGNFTPPVNWRRRQFTIPKQYIPLWGEMVPVMTIRAPSTDVRNLRLRFYADPFLEGDISDDPCSYCGDIIVSYIPAGTTMILDGTEQTVVVRSQGGVEQRADSLVFASDGTPFDWPSLSCGFGYVVTVDLPEQDAPPIVDLSLHERVI